jgi:2-hydroxy-6-oxonona-2,4-dienedioate hydrolase
MEPLELEDQFVTTEAGYQLHYQSAGTGEPLIFLHGGGPGATSFGNFYYNAPAFLEQYQCFFYNMPGYGQSSKLVVEAPMYSFHASMLAEFMDLVGIPRAHLVCQSFGGCAAIKLAIDHPERVNKLVLMGAQPMFGGVIDPLKLMSKHAANIILDYYGGEGPTPEKMRRLLADYEMHDDSKLTDWTVNSPALPVSWGNPNRCSVTCTAMSSPPFACGVCTTGLAARTCPCCFSTSLQTLNCLSKDRALTTGRPNYPSASIALCSAT